MSKKKRQGGARAPTPPPAPRRGPVPYDVRVRIVREVLRGGHQLDVALAFGVSQAAVQKYLGLYRKGGLDALRLAGGAAGGRPRKGSVATATRRQAVVETREEHPDWGTRRIRDVLARFEGLGISETVVRRILHEEGLIDERVPTPARERPPRRFERAAPNQMWQSDIFTFLLRKHERLYVAAFMDDHSRYLVSYALAHHQKASLVLEAFERGVAAYGAPEELLTDQGRQYTAWRGETAFEETLRQHGIRHVKSRPQHPETLGKIERFWKTLWQELLSRTVFADFADCDRRLGLYVQHYNFHRPHQALGGLVPADRFFRAAPQVREAVEATVSANALRLARSQPPRKPFYLVGRLGDQDLSIAAQAGALTVKVGGEAQTIDLSRGEMDAQDHSEETLEAPQGEAAPHATLADREDRPRPGGAKALPAHPERPVGGEAGDERHRGARDLARLLLSAGDQGAAGDAASPGAGRGGRGEPGRGDASAADRGARGAGLEAGARPAPARAAALPDPQDPAGGACDDGAGETAAESALDDDWQARFADLEAEGELDWIEPPDELDADEGWRGRALRWDRKLAGAAAPWDRRGARGDDDGTQAETEREVELPAGAGDAGGAGGALRGGRGGDREDDVDERGSSPARDGAGEPADPGEPHQEVDGGEPQAEAERTCAPAGAGGGASARSGEPAARAGQADRTTPYDGPLAGGGGRGDPGPAAAGARPQVADLVASLEAVLERRRRGWPGDLLGENDDDDGGGGDDA